MMLKILAPTALLLLASTVFPPVSGAKPNCDAADRYVSDDAKVGSKQLAEAIICFASEIMPSAPIPSDDDRAAAEKIIKLASKIIGNGAPMKTGKPLDQPSRSVLSEAADLVFGPNAKTAEAAPSTDTNRPADNTESAKEIICHGIVLLGATPTDPTISSYKGICAKGDGAKREIIRQAYKIIGNG